MYGKKSTNKLNISSSWDIMKARRNYTVICAKWSFATGQIAEELYGQIEGNDGSIALSDDFHIIKLSAKAELIKEFVPFETNNKRLINKLYSYFERKALNGEYYEDLEKLNALIINLMCKLTESEVIETEFGAMNLNALFKAIDFRLNEEKYSLEESVVNYMMNVRELDGNKIFVFLNLMSFIDEEQRELFFKTIVDHRFNTLFLEPRAVNPHDLVNQIIIDEDFCVI